MSNPHRRARAALVDFIHGLSDEQLDEIADPDIDLSDCDDDELAEIAEDRVSPALLRKLDAMRRPE